MGSQLSTLTPALVKRISIGGKNGLKVRQILGKMFAFFKSLKCFPKESFSNRTYICSMVLLSGGPKEAPQTSTRLASNRLHCSHISHRSGRPREINFISRYICFSQIGPFDVCFEELFSKVQKSGLFFRKIVF